MKDYLALAYFQMILLKKVQNTIQNARKIRIAKITISATKPDCVFL